MKLGRYVEGTAKITQKIFGAVPVSASGPKRAIKFSSSRLSDFGPGSLMAGFTE